MKIIMIISLALLLLGCAGIGLEATNDPYKKLSQAHMLMREERDAMAEDRINSAMGQFKQNGDEKGMADAYHAYGSLYKNNSYHEKWSNWFKRQGTYDGTYMKSIKNYEKAIELFEKLGDGTGVAKCLVGIGNVHGILKARDMSCDYYYKALNRYHEAIKTDSFVEPRMNNPNYNNMGELIEAFISHDCKN